MSKKRRRGSKPPGQRSPSERRNTASGGRITAPKDKARGSTFTAGEQAIVVGNDGVTKSITNDRDRAWSQLPNAPALSAALTPEQLKSAIPRSISMGFPDKGEHGFEVYNVPATVNDLAHWKATGKLPLRRDGSPKRIALRVDGGDEPVEPRIDELVAQLRRDGTTNIADFIEAGHWFDAGPMTEAELMAQGYGHRGGGALSPADEHGLRQFQTGYALMAKEGNVEGDLHWSRVADMDNNEFDPDWPHRHFSDYTHVPDNEDDPGWRVTAAPDIFKHRMGYQKDAPRDLSIPVDADGDHMLSHGDGCALAHSVHRDTLDFWQSEFGQAMCRSFFLSQENPQANLIFSFPADTTIDTAPAYMAKKLAGAQVMWVDQMMAEVIDAGADLLWQEGAVHDAWPMHTAEDMEVFNNIFVVSVQKDEHGTWPNVKWGTIGHTTGATPKENWVNYEPGDLMPFHKERGLYWIQMTDWMMPCNETILEFDTARQALTGETMDLLVGVMHSLRKRGEASPEHMNLPGWVASSGCLAVSVAARSFFDYITRRPLQEVYVPRAMRRNAERKHGTIRPTIKIVTLPRAPHRPGKHNKTDRKLTCQFWVDEHRRYQHYPSLGPAYHDDGEWNRESHKPILIPGYVKGPEDRPWKATKGTVYRLAKKQEERGTL